MENKSNEKLLVTLAIFIIFGIGGYLGYKKLKSIKEEGNSDNDKKPSETTDSTTLNTDTPNPNSSKINDEKLKNLAIAYRLWANSTDALSKKYGKKSKFDLDNASSNPSKGTFPASFKQGSEEYSKALMSGEARKAKNELERLQKTKTYSNDWYTLRVDELEDLFSGYTNNNDENKIITIMKKVNTFADFNALIVEFGLFQGKVLTRWLQWDLNNLQLAEINAYYVSKGVFNPTLNKPVRIELK